MAAVSANATPAPTYGYAVQRITSIPVVSESLSFAQSTINAHPLLTRGYSLGESVVSSSLKVAEPVTTRLQPQLALADQWALKGLDFAEAKVPYPFNATSSDIISHARAPADQAWGLVHAYAAALQRAYDERVIGPAKSLYDARVAPVYGNAQAQFEQLKSQNAYLQRAADIVGNLQTNLSKNLEAVSTRGKSEADQAAQKAQGISNAIFAELERVRGFALSLPTESRKRVDPVLSTFTEAYETLSKEARDTSVPVTTRLNKVVAYVREQSLPALHKAVVSPDAASTPVVNGVSK